MKRTLVLAMVMALVAGLPTLHAAVPQADRNSSAAVLYMQDVALATKAAIRRHVEQSLRKTQLLAMHPQLVEALKQSNAEALVAFANEAIRYSLELDVVALFDASGTLLAMNTVDGRGTPIAPERIARVMQQRFEDRPIISHCLVNQAQDPIMEFQTHCDFTPALFDSSGLSVAFSMPVVDTATGMRLGVVSTRLNFQRMTELATPAHVAAVGNKVWLVSDAGEYFSEEINAGRQPPPIEPSFLNAVVEGAGGNEQIFVSQASHYLMVSGLRLPYTLEGGGLHVVVQAPKAWVDAEQHRNRLYAQLLIALTIGFVLTILLVLLRLFRRTTALRAAYRYLQQVQQDQVQLNQALSAAKQELERQVEQRAQELQLTKEDLERHAEEHARAVKQMTLLNDLMLGREERIIELKALIHSLEAQFKATPEEKIPLAPLTRGGGLIE